VQPVLRRHDSREYFELISDDGRRRLVAGRFERKDFQRANHFDRKN
jgi:hypothetical protein